jgi:hypothetical protein
VTDRRIAIKIFMVIDLSEWNGWAADRRALKRLPGAVAVRCCMGVDADHEGVASAQAADHAAHDDAADHCL